MRCHACNARNSDDATWCTQCYSGLATLPPEAPTGAAGPPDGSRGAGDGAWLDDLAVSLGLGSEQVQREPAVVSPSAVERGIRERDGEVEWRCASCGDWNHLLSPACSVCSTPRSGFGDAPSQPAPTDGPTAWILPASLLLPGLGHVLAGRVGTGVARGMLAILWLLGGLALVSGSSGVRSLPGWWLVIAAGALWVTTAVDAWSLASGRGRQLLGTRGLSLLLIVATVGFVLAAAVAVIAGR